MDDKTFLEDPPLLRQKRKSLEEWIAPLDREIRELERLIDEGARLRGLLPLDHPSASSKRR